MNGIGAMNVIFNRLLPIMNDTNKPNGGIYKRLRPLNSNKEDIVVNTLALNRDDLQIGIINVNIHVPNLSINNGGIIDNTQPNIARIQQLTALVEQLVDNTFIDSCNFEIEQDNLFEEEKSTYNNIRLNFRILNN